MSLKSLSLFLVLSEICFGPKTFLLSKVTYEYHERIGPVWSDVCRSLKTAWSTKTAMFTRQESSLVWVVLHSLAIFVNCFYKV